MSKRNARAIVTSVFVVAIGLYVLATHPRVGMQTIERAASSVPFVSIARGEDATVTERVNYVITTQDELKDLWKVIGSGAPLPAIDFTQQSVLAVFAGRKGSGGYSIEVSAVRDSATARMVTITLGVPGSGCMETQALTSPYEIVAVPVSTLALGHQDVVSKTSCAQ